MKKIKLEAGKTYLSRKGEEVKIVSKDSTSSYPYQGSNGRRYIENGKWDVHDREHPDDLIEEVEEAPETRHTFTIPDGVKEITVEQVRNRIVVEMVPEKEPKPGDVMISDWGAVYIFKSDKYNGGYHTCFAWLGESGNLLIGDWCIPGRPATPEEAKPLFDALKKAGKRWNAETMRVEDIPEIDRIREWVEANIKEGYYVREDVTEAIEDYLKHKEGE